MGLLLNPPQANNKTYSQLSESEQAYFNSTSLMTFFSTQELYFGKIIDKLVSVFEQTNSDYITVYNSITQVVFLVFLAVQLIMLLILRSRLIETMKEDTF